MQTQKPSRAKRQKRPKHSGVVRVYRFPLDTNRQESAKLFNTVHLCWEARERLVADREADRVAQRALRAAGEKPRYLTVADQYISVARLARDEPRFAAVQSQVLQNVAVRVDEATKRWLETFKSGRRGVRPPHSIEKKEYTSFTYPQYGASARLRHGVLHLSKLGQFRVRDYRRMRGTPKTVTVKFADGRWWVLISCHLQAVDVYRSATEVQELDDTGADTGLTALLTTAHGEVFDPPKALKESLAKLRHEQRNMSRKFEVRKAQYLEEQARRAAQNAEPLPALREIAYSNRLKKQISTVAKLHTKAKNIRQYHHRKIADRIEKTYRCVAVEEHPIKFMLKNRKLARSVADRSIYAQKQQLKSKLGNRYVPVPNKRPGIGGNSQSCLCGEAVPKSLKDRIHECPKCGLRDNRDVVSANIAMLIGFGRAQLMSRPAAGLAVVIRGETEEVGTSPHLERASASEVSVKRTPHANLRKRGKTGGAKATPAAKTPVHRPKKPLPGAAKFPIPPVEGTESRKHRPLGR
ncbi:transposase [Paraburkholderia sp. UCT31]|uniref:RNA-guided endonuclease InsQ/TnpB family protein n=1 Tax=Paraburkholderia sp. UCT31 TaxID=2615209 RepID=UPI001656771D|nr:transposase [Paraburkholderia sp. UCT31]MBC8737398.1 transposase [Paraburkholderia sp. UCT31]